MSEPVHDSAALPPQRRMWRLLVPVVTLGAGLLFATSANVSRGTDLRSEGTGGLVGLVRTAQRGALADQQSLRQLTDEANARTAAAASSNAGVAAIQRRLVPQKRPAGLTAVHGPGLTVTLDDAHHAPTDPSIDPNDTVVHQSDLQAVVNSLWAGGAEAMTIVGQRVIATSAVRCVGNTLLLNGQVYSPPFVITAIGPSIGMRSALGRSPGVALYRQAANVLGLTYEVQNSLNLSIGAFDGTIELNSAKVDK
jgi:uncharacterized protein YlxW (UPF0749 family)